MNRRERREQKRAMTKYALDGPTRQPQCGQRRAVARDRARAEKERPAPETEESRES